MITEQHELLNARFIDDPRKTIKALWVDPDTKEIVEEVIQVKQNDANYEYLLKFISVENIHQNTQDSLKDERKIFVETVKNIAEAEGLLVPKSKESQFLIFDEFNEYIFGEEEDKEFLFKLKLSAFGLDFVKKYKGRKLKSELRKANTGLEVYKKLFEIKTKYDEQNVSDGSSDVESD